MFCYAKASIPITIHSVCSSCKSSAAFLTIMGLGNRDMSLRLRLENVIVRLPSYEGTQS
jgi:hypothetical protein